MLNSSDITVYNRENCVVFLKTHEKWGELSNMAAGFPIMILGTHILTSEALYQACRFPHREEIQNTIINQASPMAAKMVSKPYRKDSRPDWEAVQDAIMYWCLRIKLAQNWHAFKNILLATGDKPIVEESRRDQYWGAKSIDDMTLEGGNKLGKFLIELRTKLQEDEDSLRIVQPLAIQNFTLLGKQIGVIEAPSQHPGMPIIPATPPPSRTLKHKAPNLPTLFDLLEQREDYDR